MLFTENRYDRSIEWMMKGVPNFYARSSGIVVTGKFEYTAEMCDCRLCEHYGGKLRGCKVPRCVCLEERIAVGAASLKEVMKETMSEIKHSGFNRRLRREMIFHLYLSKPRMTERKLSEKLNMERSELHRWKKEVLLKLKKLLGD